MAEAVQELFPGTQVTIGPVIENGFYYDFYREESFTPEDLAKIEEKMRAIVAADKPFTKEVWPRDKAREFFADEGEGFKVELVDAIPEGENVNIYTQGKWLDLCRGPHLPSTGKVGTAFKLMRLAGSYWRGDSNREQLQRIYGTAWTTKEQLDAYLLQLEEAEKRDHRRLGREMDLFHLQEEAPGSVFWHPERLDAVPRAHRLHAPPPGGQRLCRGELARHDGEEALGAVRPLGEVRREHVRHRDPGRARVLLQADELPRPHSDLQEWAQELPRPAAAHRGVRQGAPLRAERRAARHHARALVHPGRRAYLLHPGPDDR